jgi:hypothetical protein
MMNMIENDDRYAYKGFKGSLTQKPHPKNLSQKPKKSGKG